MHCIRRSPLFRDLELAELLLTGIAGAIRCGAGGSSLVLGTVFVCLVVGVVKGIDQGVGINLEAFNSAC